MIELFLTLIIVGFLLGLFNLLIPVDGKVKTLINAVVIFILVLYVVLFFLNMFGIYHTSLHIPK